MIIPFLLLICHIDTDNVSVLFDQQQAFSCALDAYLEVVHFHDLLLIRILRLGL